MSDISAILGLPYLLPSQAQKHVTHNEALRLLDVLVQLRVVSFDAETPPADPAEGEIHALGAAPTGAWAGQGGTVAAWIDGVVIFLAPAPGWRAWGAAEQDLRVWQGTAWARPPAPQTMPQLGLNADADTNNRLTVAAAAALFTHDGAGHQLKVNKAGASDTATLLFQSNFTGHAEMGLAGDTDFALKVSEDGSSWHSALTASAASGVVSLPQGLALGGSDVCDIYAKGSWSPEIADAASGGNLAAATASGQYTRIGNQLTLSFEILDIDTSGLTPGSDLYVRGLPFAPVCPAIAPLRTRDVAFTTPPFGDVAAGATTLRLRQNLSGGTGGFLSVADITSSSAALFASFSYLV